MIFAAHQLRVIPYVPSERGRKRDLTSARVVDAVIRTNTTVCIQVLIAHTPLLVREHGKVPFDYAQGRLSVARLWRTPSG